MSNIVKVARLWDYTPEIRCFELVPLNGSVAEFTAGAHIEVHLSGNMVRQYSLWNGPEERNAHLIGVKREQESREGSTQMHELAQGDTIKIGALHNNFELRPDGEAILLAGGFGITPVLSMSRQMQAAGRRAVLHLFARDADNAPVHLGLNPPTLDKVLFGILSDPPAGAHIYFCGPGPFMNLVEQTALSTGWPLSRTHLERLSIDPEDIDTSGDRFEVVLRQSGQTIVEAMEAVGLVPLTSCEQGVCGTCLTDVLEGKPDHRDQYLNETEKAAGKLTLPCVSRCKGERLVLDL
ncbi:MAG: oxidoreductase [Rhodobacteraceae bacterium]|nr:oxidoreductase [Paracoccaceae bacterium]